MSNESHRPQMYWEISTLITYASVSQTGRFNIKAVLHVRYVESNCVGPLESTPLEDLIRDRPKATPATLAHPLTPETVSTCVSGLSSCHGIAPWNTFD